MPSAATPSHEGRNSFRELLIVLGTSASQQRSMSYPRLCYQQDTAGSRNSQAPKQFQGGSPRARCGHPSRGALPFQAGAASPGLTSVLFAAPAPRPWGWGPSVLAVRRQNPGRGIPAGNSGSEPPFLPAKMQIQAHRTRDLWTQQYLCIPAKVRGRGNYREFFPLGNNETVNPELSRYFCFLLKPAVPWQVQKRRLVAFQLVISN